MERILPANIGLRPGKGDFGLLQNYSTHSGGLSYTVASSCRPDHLSAYCAKVTIGEKRFLSQIANPVSVRDMLAGPLSDG